MIFWKKSRTSGKRRRSGAVSRKQNGRYSAASSWVEVNEPPSPCTVVEMVVASTQAPTARQ